MSVDLAKPAVQFGLRVVMTDLPPGPWQYMTTAAPNDHPGMGHVYIVDATGKKLMSLWGKPDVKMALAALIIEARDAIAMPPAILAAMREPTNKQVTAALEWGLAWMKQNGVDHLSPYEDFPPVAETCRGMWRAMVDAMLGETAANLSPDAGIGRAS